MPSFAPPASRQLRHTDAIGAVVVTYHPDDSVLENLRALREQVDQVVVVDNGSSLDQLQSLRELCSELAIDLVENGANLGIATALNAGVRTMMQRDLPYILLFDQDSCVTPGFIQTMLDCARESQWGDRLGILVPRYMDRRLHVEIPPDRVRQGLETAMTSGGLIRAATFREFGVFVDEMFIDGVDYEFSLRLRRAGRILECCDEATLLHSPGEPRAVRFGGRKLYQTANYSPVRRYYQERNKLWLARRYYRTFPGFFLRHLYVSFKDLLKIILSEDDKRVKIRYFLRGIGDGLRGRSGPIEAHRVEKSSR